MDKCISLEKAITTILKKGISAEFTGFGAVIYQGEIKQFPTTPLIEKSELLPPVVDVNQIASLLISLSHYSDYRHDGFHFINNDQGLTHLSVFISPVIPTGYEPTQFNVGARYRSAELISKMNFIEAVLIIEKTGHINKFINGKFA